MRERQIAFAIIGAGAMAVHGVSRSTRDLDIFTIVTDILTPDTWAPLERTGVAVQIERGDAQDPLAGVIRLSTPHEHPIDVIVGKSAWQGGILRRARVAAIEGVDVPVAAPSDLILLKLYAGGPQDAWDIEQLLASLERATVTAEVETTLDRLPAECRRLWERLRGS